MITAADKFPLNLSVMCCKLFNDVNLRLRAQVTEYRASLGRVTKFVPFFEPLSMIKSTAQPSRSRAAPTAKSHKPAQPNKSTDNQGETFVAPPLKAPFKPLAQADYVCIIHGTDRPFCLPPGSYHKQGGLGFEIKKVDSLTLPPGGWSLAVHWKHMQHPHERGPAKHTDRTYSENLDPNKKSDELTSFEDGVHAIDQDCDGEATFTVIGPTDGPDPVCCLFTEPKFGGNAWCVGVGGDDVLPQWKDKAQSVSCHNGGQVWLYPKEYGDAGAALIKGNVEDLKDEPYGNAKDTFSKNVKALWVLKG